MSQIVIQVNKRFSGKPTIVSKEKNTWLVNGEEIAFPNNNRKDWSQPKEITLEKVKEFTLLGKTIRFGIVAPNISKDKNRPLYTYCTLQYGGYVDLDDLSLEDHEKVLKDDLFNHSFLINYSFSTDLDSKVRSSHAAFRYSRPLNVQSSEHQHVIKAIYFYLDQTYKIKDGKFDSGCFDPCRLKFGTRNDERYILKFDQNASLDVDHWLNYYEENKSLIERKTYDKDQKIGQSENFWLQALKDSTSHVIDWSDPNAISFYPSHDWILRKDQSDDEKTQYDGYDFRDWLPNTDDRSRSMCLTFYSDGEIEYCARGNGNKGGGYFQYLQACYQEKWFSDYDTFENCPEGKQLFYRSIEAFLESKNLDSVQGLLDDFNRIIKNRKSEAISDRFFDKSKKSQVFNEYWQNDRLVNLEALKDACPFALEEVKKDDFKLTILPIRLAKIFNSFYRGRIKAIQCKSSRKLEFAFYMNTEINGEICYFWYVMNEDYLKSKISRWLDFYYHSTLAQYGETLVELMFSRCKHDLTEGIRQLLCTLDKTTKEEFSSVDDHLVPFANGLYSLKDKVLYPYTPDFNTNRIIPFFFEAGKGQEEFNYVRSFFRDWFDVSEDLKDEVTQYFLEIVMVTWMFQAEHLKMILWIVGESNSGKNEKMQALMSVMNPYEWKHNFTRINKNSWDFPKKFTRNESVEILFDGSNRFATIQAYQNCYWMLFDEVDRLTMDQLAKIKASVGTGNKVRGEEKGADSYEVSVKALHTFLSERDPQIPYNNIGGVKRLQLFNVAPMDYSRHLEFLERMSDPEFLKNLFLYAANQDILGIVKKLQKSEPKFMTQRKVKFQEDNNPYLQFFLECFELDDNYFLTVEQVTNLFGVVSNTRNLKPNQVSRNFNTVLREQGFPEENMGVKKRVQIGGLSHPRRIYQGLKFSEGAYDYSNHFKDPDLELQSFEIKK